MVSSCGAVYEVWTFGKLKVIRDLSLEPNALFIRKEVCLCNLELVVTVNNAGDLILKLLKIS